MVSVNDKLTPPLAVPQHAWVQSGTIRENITFSSKPEDVDMARVNEVIDACGLRPDIEMWGDGDQSVFRLFIRDQAKATTQDQDWGEGYHAVRRTETTYLSRSSGIRKIGHRSA